MKPGELVVAQTDQGVDHIAHLYKGGAIFSFCGLHEGLTPPSDDHVPNLECRRCRIRVAETIRDHLRDIAELTAEIDWAEAQIDRLRKALEK